MDGYDFFLEEAGTPKAFFLSYVHALVPQQGSLGFGRLQPHAIRPKVDAGNPGHKDTPSGVPAACLGGHADRQITKVKPTGPVRTDRREPPWYMTTRNAAEALGSVWGVGGPKANYR